MNVVAGSHRANHFAPKGQFNDHTGGRNLDARIRRDEDKYFRRDYESLAKMQQFKLIMSL